MRNRVKGILNTLKYQLISKNTWILLGCIFIAAIFWLLIALSKDYVTDIKVSARYSNTPQDKVLINELPNQLTIQVLGNGWILMKNHFNLSSTQVNIDLNRFGNNNVFYPNDHQDYFANQLSDPYQLRRIIPREIHFEFDDKVEKKIPVRFNGEIQLDPLFGLTDSVKVDPDSITISGASVIVDSINFVETEPVKLEDVDENISETVALQKPVNGTVEFSQQNVLFTVKVKPFTEVKIQVPVEKVNDNREVRLMTKKVNITFQLPMEAYNNYSQDEYPDLFKVVADFSNVKKTDEEVTLQIATKPPFAQKINITPKKIKFLFIEE